MKAILTLAAITISLQATAATKQHVNNKIRDLRFDLRDSQATSQELDQVVELIEEAQDILMGYGDSVDFQTCFNYVFPQYDRSTSSSTATTKATNACRKVVDLDVLEYSFNQYDRSASSMSAMDKAVQKNTRAIKGKLDIIKFAHSKYDRSMSSSSAMDRALTGAGSVRKDALSCLQLVYPKHDRSTSSSNAMDKSFQDCR